MAVKRRYEVRTHQGFTFVLDQHHGGAVCAFEGDTAGEVALASQAAGKLGLMQAALRLRPGHDPAVNRAEQHRRDLLALPGIITQGLDDWRTVRAEDLDAP